MADRVMVAVEASAQFARSVGAVVIDAHVREIGAVPVNTNLVEDIAVCLTEKLRGSDFDGPVGQSSIVIYLPLLNSQDNLHAIARRMHGNMVHFLDTSGLPEYTSARRVLRCIR
jgi:hypothetical protein